MTSKALLNNMLLIKKRDASVDHQINSRFQQKPQDKLSLPQLKQAQQGSGKNLLPQPNGLLAPRQAMNNNNQVKYTRSSNHRSIERAAVAVKNQKQHSRMGSIEYPNSNQSTQHSTAQLSAISSGFLNLDIKERKYDLISDYGKQIDTYLKELQDENSIGASHLSNHKINGIYRAKMVDWMVEVLTAFKCSDQTFFLAINIMDRYFDALNKDNIALELTDLHTTGIICMFMASKYEDIYPLLMKTVYSKIGHSKISVDAIRNKEMEILRVLSFQIGSYPTVLEFQQSYIEQAFKNHEDRDFIKLMTIYLGKMALHHENLCTKQSNLLAASSIYVALKICEQMRQKPMLTKATLQQIIDVSGIEEKKLIECAKKVLYLAQNFEKELPGLQNVKECYIPLLNQFVQQ